MYAILHHYRTRSGSIDAMVQRIDAEFADRIPDLVGTILYTAVDTGDGTAMTITLFGDERTARRSQDAVAQVQQTLAAEFQVEETALFEGEVMVNRATEKLIEPIHHGASAVYASVRHYRMGAGTVDDLMHHVDTEFADRLQKQLGLLGYQAIDTGDGTIVTTTIFPNEEACRRAETAADNVRQALARWKVDCTQIFTGEVMVSRASKELQEPIHH